MELAEFIKARLKEEEPGDRCGCLDTNHVPACTPQPWKDRKRREIAAVRAILAAFELAVANSEPQDHFEDGLAYALEQIASVWNDHPAYRPERDWGA